MALSEECADKVSFSRKDKIKLNSLESSAFFVIFRLLEKTAIMVRDIISLIFMTLILCSAVVFVDFVISKLRKIDAKTDNIPKLKHSWSMGVYMNDIPQNEQNTLYLGSVSLRIYERDKYSDLPVPRVGEEVSGIYRSGENRFDMNGIVTSVHYNTNMDWITVECKCTDIRKRPKTI